MCCVFVEGDIDTQRRYAYYQPRHVKKYHLYLSGLERDHHVSCDHHVSRVCSRA
jgi:hypothetical protein